MERAAERESAAEKRYQDLQQKQRELIRRANTRADRKEMTQRQKEKRELRELQQKTLRQLQWLSKNRRKAPADLRKVWDETLGDIDIFAAGVVRETFRGEPLRAKWENMAQIYKQAQSSDKNFLPTPQLATIVKRLDNYKIENMDYAALKDLYDAAVGLHKEFSERNNVIDDEYNRLMSEVYEDSKKEIEGADNKFLGMTLLTPVNMLEGMAGWNPDSTFFSMAKQLEKGERDMHTHEAQANKLLEKFLRENEKWARRAGGQGKDGIWYEEEVPELIDLKYGDDPVFGKKVKVHFTAAQKVHMYLEIQNEDNLRHMVGGRTFADKELYKKGKREEAFYKGTTVALAPETARWLVRDMTPQELGLARALDSYYNGYSKAKINEVSNKLYGYDKAIGTSYAPIYTNQNYTQNEIGVFDITAEGVGNLKERLLSKVPTLNIGAFDAFERSVGKTARFVGMAIPARNWNTLLNRKDKGYDNSMMDVITHKWGKAGKEKIKNVLEELQGGGEQKLNIVDSAVQKYVWGKYISSTFAANPSIVLKQLGSIPMAGAYLGGKNKPSLAKVFKVNRDLIGKYTSELDYRLMGYATPETRQIKENPSLLDRNRVSRFFLRGGAITAMDGWAAGTLWPWAENKVRREHPELETGTQEEIDAGQSPFYRAVAEEFNNALNRSQSVSDIMHQSELRRDKGTIARMLTQFKSDTAQAYNALWQSLGEARHYARRGEKTEAGKAASRAALVAAKKVVGGVLWGIALNQIWGAAIDFLMNLWKKEGDRYTDENGELTLESVVGEAGYSIATSIFGLVPGGEELAEVLGSWVLGRDWWGIEAPGIEQINDLIEGLGKAGKKIGDIVGGGIDIANNGGDAWEHLDRNKAELLGGVKDIAKTVTRYVPGLPLDNIEAYLLGTVRKVFPGAATAYEDAFAEADKAGLAGLEGDALEARVAGILDNRLNGAKGETAAALAGLYAEGFKKAIPSDTPSSISVDGESVKLTAYQKQTYDLVWRSAVGASLDDLTASREFGSASDEDKEKMLDRLYRYAGEKAKQELFDGYEPDDWVSKADEAVKSGMSAGEWATLYTEISLIDGDTTLKGAQKSNKKREVISHSGLSDAQKIMLYSHTISEERIDDIKAFQTAKLPFDVFLAAQNEYATLNERKDLTATQKATELSRWANQRGYKGEQAAAIRDTFTFFSMAPAEARRYNELTDSGVNDEDAYELTNALNELEPLEGNKSVTNLQRYRETVDISTNPDIQLSLLMSVMGETEIQKVKLAYDYGVTPRDYVRAKELIAEDNKQKKAEDEDYGGVKNKDVEDVLESMDDLTRNQQAALYQVITRAKRNPFGSRIRREIEKALEGDGE
jgi:hypothetical protein